jgi:hypothetical protein
MNKFIIFLFLIFKLNAEELNLKEFTNIMDLKTIKFVAGRLANEQDINNGAAVFLQQVEGIRIGEPSDILVPQYAYLMIEDGSKILGIIIQAEKAADRDDIIGFYSLAEDDFSVALLNEFQLLGKNKPRH